MTHLEGLILSGQLKPGERLPPERELQNAFGVGRPAISEALITLERSGLVEIGNGAPARVALPTTAGLLSALVANHGPVVSDVSLEAAVTAAEELEDAARLIFIIGAKSAERLSPEDAEFLLCQSRRC